MKKLPRTVAIIVIIAATFLGYWPALRNGFVWDDTALCFRDPLIRSWILIPEGFRHFLFLDATASDFYRPLQRLTFTADYQLYSFAQPWGWHLTSILIHAAAAVALWFFVRKLSASLPAKALADDVSDWLALGVAGLLFRTVHLFFLYDVQTGLVWATKIITDPFHDAWIYRGAPLALLRGELLDPMWHARAEHTQRQ